VGEKDITHIEDLTTTKEERNNITDVFIGNASARHRKFEELSNETEGFLMEEGADHEDMYHRLKDIAITFINLGSYRVDDDWV
jgi:hypothetical protein